MFIKHVILFVLLMVVNVFVNGQDLAEITTFTVRSEVVAEEYDFLGQTVKDKRVVLLADIVFEEVNHITDDGVNYSIIKPIEKLRLRKKRLSVATDLPTVDLHTYYRVGKEVLAERKLAYTPRKWELRVGYAVIPIKVFPFQEGPLDFTASNVSQGPSIGLAQQVSRRKSDLWLVYNFGMNFTKITPRKDDFTTGSFDGNDLAALSPALGVSLSYNSVNFGIFVGKDYLPGSAASAWRYNGATWYSISIGASFEPNRN